MLAMLPHERPSIMFPTGTPLDPALTLPSGNFLDQSAGEPELSSYSEGALISTRPRQLGLQHSRDISSVSHLNISSRELQPASSTLRDSDIGIEIASASISRRIIRTHSKSISEHLSYPVCKTCGKQFLPTTNPRGMASLLNPSRISSSLTFGIVLPCPKKHSYCLDCMTTYLLDKLDYDDRGKAVPAVDPKCPHCKLRLSDEVVERTLTPEDVVRWRDQKITIICGICNDRCLENDDPQNASASHPSSRPPLGIVLPCPKKHSYCHPCMNSFLRINLDDGDKGSVVFPVRCPECKIEEWQMEDEVAQKLLDREDMVRWYHQKLLDTTPKYYCPYPRCSALFEVDEIAKGTPAKCPACHKLLCIACGVPWHLNMSCERYQTLSKDEQTSDFGMLLELANSNKWTRCRNCMAFVERVSGCPHITCKCKAQFCYSCGAEWKGACTRKPTCNTLSEADLVRERTDGRLDMGRPQPATAGACSSTRSGVGLRSLRETASTPSTRDIHERKGHVISRLWHRIML